MVASFPGTIVLGISVICSSNSSLHAKRATSRSTLYFKCCIFVSNFLTADTFLPLDITLEITDFDSLPHLLQAFRKLTYKLHFDIEIDRKIRILMRRSSRRIISHSLSMIRETMTLLKSMLTTYWRLKMSMPAE